MLVRDLTDGDEFELALLVRAAEERTARDGRELLRLRLGDRSGSLPALVREPTEEDRALLRAGAVVHVRGRRERHERFGAELALEAWRAATPEEAAAAELQAGPPRPPERMEEDLRALLATVREPHLRRLLDAIFGAESETWARFREAPAAKHYHQAYRHGLLEHTLTVAQGVGAMAATFPGIDRDVAVTGALLHDVGKLDAYAIVDASIEMTDAGRLLGEIPLGFARVRDLIAGIDGFPPPLAQAILHIVLSHHGTLAHGSPIVPQTREATLVHMVDNLGGRLGSFDRLEQGLAAGARWSSWDKALGAGAWFPGAPTPPPPPGGELAA